MFDITFTPLEVTLFHFKCSKVFDIIFYFISSEQVCGNMIYAKLERKFLFYLIACDIA